MSDWLASVCLNFQAQRASRKPKLQAVAGLMSIRPNRNDLAEGHIKEILWNRSITDGWYVKYIMLVVFSLDTVPYLCLRVQWVTRQVRAK